MDTVLLRSFYKVASVGSFSEAARLLNASQSTVSGHIAKLEDYLQTQLFRRTTRSCQLTTAGDVLLTHVTTLLQVIDRIEEEFCPRVWAARSSSGCRMNITCSRAWRRCCKPSWPCARR